MDNATTAIILGNLMKRFVAQEIVNMLATGNVVRWGEGARILVYGDTLAELKENRARCYDAVKTFGVGLLKRKQSRNGSTIVAVPFANDPFNQIKHYYSELTVSYL